MSITCTRKLRILHNGCRLTLFKVNSIDLVQHVHSWRRERLITGTHRAIDVTGRRQCASRNVFTALHRKRHCTALYPVLYDDAYSDDDTLVQTITVLTDREIAQETLLCVQLGLDSHHMVSVFLLPSSSYKRLHKLNSFPALVVHMVAPLYT